jgi:hypothetical protein
MSKLELPAKETWFADFVGGNGPGNGASVMSTSVPAVSVVATIPIASVSVASVSIAAVPAALSSGAGIGDSVVAVPVMASSGDGDPPAAGSWKGTGKERTPTIKDGWRGKLSGDLGWVLRLG